MSSGRFSKTSVGSVLYTEGYPLGIERSIVYSLKWKATSWCLPTRSPSLMSGSLRRISLIPTSICSVSLKSSVKVFPATRLLKL